MKVVFVAKKDRLIAFHTPDTAPPLEDYASNGAVERQLVNDAALTQIGVPSGPVAEDEVPTIRVVTVLVEGWRDLIIAPAEAANA